MIEIELTDAIRVYGWFCSQGNHAAAERLMAGITREIGRLRDCERRVLSNDATKEVCE